MFKNSAMRAIWVTAHLNSFLIEELRALSERLDVCVLSQDWLRTPHPEREPFEQLRPDSLTVAALPRRAAALVQSAPKVHLRSSRALNELRLVARYRESLLRHVRSRGISVIHSHFGTPHGTGAIIDEPGVIQIITLRGYEFLDVPEIGYGLTREEAYVRRLQQAARTADAVTVASGRSLDRARKTLGPNANLKLIPNGADLERFMTDQDTAQARRELDLDPDLPLILGVGHVVPVKGWADLLYALHSLEKDGYKTNVRIVGRTDEGDEPARIRALIHELGLQRTVKLTGSLPLAEIPRYYNAASVLVHPSYSEGFGNVILEAMASALPVIATTETGAALDLIEDGKDGFIVPIRQPQRIAQHLATLLDHPERARDIGAAARAKVSRGYALADRASRFEALYVECLRSARARMEAAS